MTNDETIVAVFDTAPHAAAAVRDLEAAGVPGSSISQHAGAAGTGQPKREQGFWASLFGGDPDGGHDTAVYDRSLEGGSTVVTVRGSGAHLDQVLDILERHNPIDIDERAASYGVSQSGMTAGTVQTGVTGTRPATNPSTTGQATNTMAGNTMAGGTARGTAEPDTLRLSEETLAVGKRAINRGTTRVRRYVVETPVEEQVSLHDEHVSVERRPVSDGRAVTGADFSDKVVEMTETAEEAVVSKQARVKEEVVIRKDATDRTETVRDTLRREDVEITQEPGTASGTSAPAGSKTAAQTATVGNAPYKPAV